MLLLALGLMLGLASSAVAQKADPGKPGKGKGGSVHEDLHGGGGHGGKKAKPEPKSRRRQDDGFPIKWLAISLGVSALIGAAGAQISGDILGPPRPG